MPPALSLPAPAKLNLFLHITGQRADGYHELQTLFQLLDYGDELDFALHEGSDLLLHCDDQAISNDENLVLRAAQLLQKTAGVQKGAKIHLRKKIPAGAGLGGGSSDAATTLIALNQLWEAKLGAIELAEIGLQLGADVPVFIHGNSAWAEGVGEKLEPVTLPEHHYLVLTPNCHVETGAIFSNQQLTRNSTPIKMAAFLAGQSRNDCESLVRTLYPRVDSALRWLQQYAADARMTGTGSSVFAKFGSSAQAQTVLDALHREVRHVATDQGNDSGLAGICGFTAKGVNRSPVHQRLAAAEGKPFR